MKRESTVCRKLKKLQLGRKKKTLISSEQFSEITQNFRDKWRRWLDKIDVRNLIVIDENGVNLSMTRRDGRCSGGGRV